MDTKVNWKKQFALIYSGQAFSIIGSAAVQFAIIWWLTVKTESAITLTIATIVAFLPRIIISPFAGVWIDRHNRRNIMMLADGLVALSSVVLAIVFLITDNPPLAIIYGVLLVRSLGDTFHSPATSAVIPTIVPPEMLSKAGGWSNLITSLANILGPVFGALLIGIFKMPVVMLVDVLGATFAITCLFFVKIPDVRKKDEKMNFLGDLKSGFSTIMSNRPFKMIVLPFIVVNFLFSPIASLLPLMVKTYFGGTAWHNTIAESAFSIGTLVGSLAIGILGTGKKRFFLMGIGSVIFAVAALIAGLTPANIFPLFVVMIAIIGISNVMVNVPTMAYAQSSMPPEQLGKIMSIMTTVMTATIPIGMAIAGPASEALGINNWFIITGVMLVIDSLFIVVIASKLDKYPEKYGVVPLSEPTAEAMEENIIEKAPVLAEE